jgi:hypothetical protein
MQVSRRLRASALALAVLVGGTFTSGCFLPKVDAASYYLAAPLVPVGGATGSGRVEYLIDARQRTAFFELAGLTPVADYHVLFDGELFTTVSTDENGHGALNTSVLSSAFDPRGHRLSVVDQNGVEVLELADPTDPAYNAAEVAPLAAFAPGAGMIQTTTRGGSTTVTVNLTGVDPGVYDVLADGVVQASLDARSGHGQVVLAPPGFDPATAAIELQLEGVGYFAGGGHANIEGLDWCHSGNGVQPLEPTVSGFGQASLATRVDCGRRFDVAIHDVPMAEYDLRVGGIWRGTLAVGALEDGSTIGTATFSTSEPSMGALDFDPIGQTIDVELEGVPYFQLDSFVP